MSIYLGIKVVPTFRSAIAIRVMIKLIAGKFYLVEGRVCRFAGIAQNKYFGTIHNFIDEFDYCW
ncbi:MAG: hypothetical protein HWQ58_17025 [Nostoc sp. LPT]|uniref:hypothetical protein n=1 Tax=uncultured Nostoc sp. TaxID=340711 RepID=UPI001D9D3B7F|nr:hypothetical protein [Nostoc sp. LPT]